MVYSHPNPKSYNHAVRDVVESTAKELGHEIVTRDLYDIGFNPVLSADDFVAMQKGNYQPDVEAEHKHITWCDIMIFVFPIWWTGLPAEMKGYIDRVLSFGFAYKIDEKHNVIAMLKGKKAIVFNTTGSPNDFYEKIGMHKSLRQTIDDGILQFCGIKVLNHTFLGNVVMTTDERRKKMLEDVKKVLKENLK